MTENINNYYKRLLKALLWKVGFFPYYYLYSNPFKLYEWIIMNIHLGVNKKAIVLDLGCGNGTQTILNAGRFQKIIGIDPNERSIELANAKLHFSQRREKIQFFANNIENMNFHTQLFDGIVSYCVFEHIPNYKEVLSEFYRILKPGGWLLLSIDSLSVIAEPLLLAKHKNEHHVEKYFKKSEIEELLKKQGFENVIVEPKLMSRFAEKLFKKGIINNFRYSRITVLINAVRLFLAEKSNRRQNEGLFLVVKAYKGYKTK